jgi:TRAP-type C4-dicarboxylate transport system substrate-binding protein
MKKLLFILVALVVVSAFIITGCSTTPTPSTTAPPATTSKPPATSSAPSTPAPSTSAPPSTSKPATTTPPPANVITLKFAYDMPATGVIVPGFTWWADQVQKQSNGRVKIDFYPAGALFNQADTPDSLKAGVADISNISLTAHAQLQPITNVFGLPGMEFPDTTKDGYMAKYDAYLQLSQKYTAISSELADYKLLMWIPNPSYRIVSKKQITLPADLKGVKIGGSAAQGQIVQLAGGTPVQMIPPNMYENLSKGVVDGGFVSWSHVSVYKLPEVVSYFLDYGFTQESTEICMNLKKWNSLPPDIQKIMTDNIRDSVGQSADAFLAGNQKGIQLVKDSKKTITTLTPDQMKTWDTLVAPIQDTWIKDAQSKGTTNAADILKDLKALRAAAMK